MGKKLLDLERGESLNEFWAASIFPESLAPASLPKAQRIALASLQGIHPAASKSAEALLGKTAKKI